MYYQNLDPEETRTRKKEHGGIDDNLNMDRLCQTCFTRQCVDYLETKCNQKGCEGNII